MLFYRCLLTLLTPVLIGALFIRVLRKQETFGDFGERLGFWKLIRPIKTTWIHGASNGELTAGRALIEALLKSEPDATVLITCNSVSAKQMVEVWALERVVVLLAPIDFRWIYQRILARTDLQKFILLEADFWPNRTHTIQVANTPSALIGGRISQKSAKMWKRFPALSKRMFSAFELICPQDKISANRLLELGALPDAFGTPIALKSLYQSKDTRDTAEGRDAFWLAASTHEGEDEILLRAHLNILKTAPSLRMILAPRHPKRGDQIAKLAKQIGLSTTQRSKNDSFETESQVFIADTLGEMELWYRAAGICFVAGSLIAKGGHTPFEPLAFDCALLHGPHFENFLEPYEALQRHAGTILCRSSQEIEESVLKLQNQDFAQMTRANAREVLVKTDALSTVLTALSQMSKN